MKFLSGGVSWTLDPHNSMKICENPENVLPGLWILLYLSAMRRPSFSFPDLQAAYKYNYLHPELKLENIFDFQFHSQILIIFDSGGLTLQSDLSIL